MNKKIVSITAMLAVLIFTSCEKQVTDLAPQNRLSSDLAFSTPSKIEGTVIAAYDGLQSAEFLSGRALIYVDLLGEDVFDRQGFFGDLPRFNMLANNGTAANVWTAGYNTIARANRSAAGIAANASILSGTKAKEFIAECKYIRAISHFYLVNFFAQTYVYTNDASHLGIPVITENFTSNDPAANKPRAKVSEVYTQIIKDLTEALADLPATYSTVYSTKTRATKAAAAALLARVYLYKADYTNAKLISGNIISGQYGTFSLQTAVDGMFGPGKYQTSETIWSVPNSASDNPNTNNALPQHYNPSGRADLPISASFQSIVTNPYFAADDRRRGLIINGVASTNTTAFKFTGKYPDVSTRADWAPVFRYAEVLLTYAEASARLATGVDADALSKLNSVRDRARVTAPQYLITDFTDKTALINAILGERRIELAFEGHRFWDLMRTKSNVTRKYDSDGTTILPTQNFGSDKNVFPIPQTEIDKSGGVLVKNPGY